MQTDFQQVTREVHEFLKENGIEATPQAEFAVIHAIFGLHDVAGDSDSLLYGLLMSGSYAVDALELAGVKPAILREQALERFHGQPSAL